MVFCKAQLIGLFLDEYVNRSGRALGSLNFMQLPPGRDMPTKAQGENCSLRLRYGAKAEFVYAVLLLIWICYPIQ